MKTKHHALITAAICLACMSAAAPQSAHAQSLPRGVTLRTIQDTVYHKQRRIWIYTPPAYDARRKQPYDLLISFDGEDYLDTIPLPRMLDSLYASKRIPPMVAVLIENWSGAARTSELGNSARFTTFMAQQLMPWVRANFNVTHDPHRTIISGSSAGGLGAAGLAFARPDLFGNVLSQSGAFWRGAEASNSAPFEWLTAQYAAAPKKDIRFFMDVGALENHAVLGGSGPVMTEANERLRDVLVKKGYDVVFTKVPGGAHAPEFWRLRLPTGLVVLTSDWTN